MKEVQSPIVAIACVLASVFIPVAFLSGMTGVLYKQFALTIAISMFLAVIGLRNAKVLAANAKKVALSFGDISQPVVILAAIGFIILLALEARKVRGAALISIVAATIIGIPMGITKIPATIFTMMNSEIIFDIWAIVPICSFIQTRCSRQSSNPIKPRNSPSLEIAHWTTVLNKRGSNTSRCHLGSSAGLEQ